MFDFLKKLFSKKDAPAPVVEPVVQPPAPTPPVEVVAPPPPPVPEPAPVVAAPAPKARTSRKSKSPKMTVVSGDSRKSEK